MQKKEKGFTLIELLVVMVILGVAVSLVGSFSIDWVDKAKIYDEEQRVNRWIKEQSKSAFIKSQSAQFLFDGKGIYRVTNMQAAQEPEPENILVFKSEFLFFHSQIVNFNKNGFTSPSELRFNIANEVQSLNLLRILGVNNDSTSQVN